MDEVLTADEIEKRFPSEWILLEDPETDKALVVRRGKVLYHSKDRDEFDRTVLRFRPKRFAVLYTGESPEGMEYLL